MMPCRPKFNATHAWAASSKHNAKYKKYISHSWILLAH